MEKVVLISTSAIKVPPEDYAGSELMITHLARGLRDNHDVTLVAPKGSHIDGIDIIETIPPTYRGLEGERRAFEIYKSKIPKDADIYDDHSHFCVASELNLQNHIWSCHDLLPLRKAPNVDLILARSKFHAEYLGKAWNRDSIKFVYNGVDIDHYQFNEEKSDYALFLGRMTKAKGPLEFVKICKRAGTKGTLAGETSPRRGVEQSTIWKLIKECNENENLTFLGRVPEWKKVELLRDAKAYISPLIHPYHPVFDLVLAEAQVSGTPTIVTNRGATNEVVEDETSGFVVNSVEKIPEAIERIGEIEPQNCRKHAEKFSKERMVSNYLNVYRSITKG